jgi:hypothetical protein
MIDGIECHHLAPANAAATPDLTYDLWVGKDDLLIRKFTYRKDAIVCEETHSSIQLDEEFPEGTFRVAPPE